VKHIIVSVNSGKLNLNAIFIGKANGNNRLGSRLKILFCLDKVYQRQSLDKDKVYCFIFCKIMDQRKVISVYRFPKNTVMRQL